LAEPSYHPVLRIGFGLVMVLLGIAALEMAMRYKNWPRPIPSGWRVSEAGGPINQFGWRGQPPRRRRTTDFVVVITGGGAVECRVCPNDETLDLMLERALRDHNPDIRVVTLGSSGYAQDQEFLALHEYFTYEHAELVINWASIADDVPANMFRAGHPWPGRPVLKPSFALYGTELRGPTEGIGDPIYRSKLSALLGPWFVDVDRNWTTLMPKPDPGSVSPPSGAETQMHVDEPLEQQRGAWSIWLTPRPARVQYGIELTRALLNKSRSLSMLRGARFAVLLTPAPADRAPAPASMAAPDGAAAAPIALEHNGHWFLADPATRDAAIAEVTDGMDVITLPEEPRNDSPEAARRMMARLADTLNQRGLLMTKVAASVRH
jgi:hypothetical protein